MTINKSTLSAKDFLTVDELRALRAPSDLRAFSMFVFNWSLIAFAMAVVAVWPSAVTVVVALFILGGRQLGLGILVHECSHRGFFSSVPLNDFMGHWFAGVAVLVPIDFYRPYHFKHHTDTGSKEDPDVGNIAQYPVSKASFRRKMMRDFSGVSGVKATFALLLYVLPGRAGDAVSLGINRKDIAKDSGWKMGLRNYGQVLLFHGAFFSVFYFLKQPWLYGLWWLAYLTTHPFIIRMRQIAEHGVMPMLSSNDVRKTTRTTLVGWWERLLFAPNYVNYHCEHHLVPTVPSYRLPKMHRLLKRKGFYDGHKAALTEGGYRAVWGLASSG